MNIDLLILFLEIAAPIGSFQLKATCSLWFRLFESHPPLLDIHAENMFHPKRWIFHNCTNFDLIKQMGVKMEYFSKKFARKLLNADCDESVFLHLYHRSNGRESMDFEQYPANIKALPTDQFTVDKWIICRRLKPILDDIDLIRLTKFIQLMYSSVLFKVQNVKYIPTNGIINVGFDRYKQMIHLFSSFRNKYWDNSEEMDLIIIKLIDQILFFNDNKKLMELIYESTLSCQCGFKVIDHLNKLNLLNQSFFDDWINNTEMKLWLMKNNRFDLISNSKISIKIDSLTFNKKFFHWFINHPDFEQWRQKNVIHIRCSDLFKCVDKDVVEWIFQKFDSWLNQMIVVPYAGKITNLSTIKLWEDKGGRIDWKKSHTNLADVYMYAISQNQRNFVSFDEECYELYEQLHQDYMKTRVKRSDVERFLNDLFEYPSLDHRKTTSSNFSIQQKVCRTVQWLIDNLIEDCPKLMKRIEKFAMRTGNAQIVHILLNHNHRFNIKSFYRRMDQLVWKKLIPSESFLIPSLETTDD